MQLHNIAQRSPVLLYVQRARLLSASWNRTSPAIGCHSQSVEGLTKLSFAPRSGELRTQKLKFHLVRTQSLNVLPLKPRVGQYIAIHAKITARNFFLAYFYPSGPFTCIFQNLPRFFPVLAVANTGSCVGPQNKIGHPAGCKFPCLVPTEYK